MVRFTLSLPQSNVNVLFLITCLADVQHLHCVSVYGATFCTTEYDSHCPEHIGTFVSSGAQPSNFTSIGRRSLVHFGPPVRDSVVGDSVVSLVGSSVVPLVGSSVVGTVSVTVDSALCLLWKAKHVVDVVINSPKIVTA